MRLAVVGSRSFNDKEFAFEVLDTYRIVCGMTAIVSGGAGGADAIAEAYSKYHGIPMEIYRANWGAYGNRAGYVRNVEIWDASDEGVAFWDGKSQGTMHSFDLARKKGKTLLVFNNRHLVKHFDNGLEIKINGLEKS